MYRNLFIEIFGLLKKIEGGFVYQTDGSRAFLSSVIMSVLFQINITAFFDDITMEDKLILFCVLIGINFFVLVVLGQYKVYLVTKRNDLDRFYRPVAYVYIIAMLVFWAVFSGRVVR